MIIALFGKKSYRTHVGHAVVAGSALDDAPARLSTKLAQQCVRASEWWYFATSDYAERRASAVLPHLVAILHLDVDNAQ